MCLSMRDFEFIQFGTHQLKSVGSYLLPYCGLCLLVPQIFYVNFRFLFFFSYLQWHEFFVIVSPRSYFYCFAFSCSAQIIFIDLSLGSQTFLYHLNFCYWIWLLNFFSFFSGLKIIFGSLYFLILWDFYIFVSRAFTLKYWNIYVIPALKSSYNFNICVL